MRRALLFAACLALATQPAESSLLRNKVERGDLPGWLRNALTREVEAREAAAAYLHVETIARPLRKGGVVLERRVALRILHDTALDSIGEIGLDYSSLDEVHAFEGWVIPSKGPAIELNRKEDVVDVPCEGSTIAADCRSRLIAIPRIAVGSTLAFSWVHERGIDPGGIDFLFGDVDWPTAFAQLTLEVPEGWKGEIYARREEGLERTRETGRHVLTGRALAPAPDLPRRPPADEVLPLAWAHWHGRDGRGGFRSWDELGAWHRKLSEPVMRERAAAAALAKRWAPASPEEIAQSLETAHAFVAGEVRYTALYMPMGGYRPRPPHFVATKRFGDCKDKSYLFRALVEEWGLESFPVLVEVGSARELERRAPSLDQFDHIIAAVKLPEGVEIEGGASIDVRGLGRVLFADTTVGREAPPWTLASSYQGKEALLVTASGSRLVRIPLLPPGRSKRALTAQLEVGNSGRLLEGHVERVCTGDEAWAARERLAGLDDQKRGRRFASQIQQILPGSKMTEFEIVGLNDSSRPLIERASVRGGVIGKRAGDYLVIEPGRLDEGLAIGDLPAPPRPWPLRIGSTRSVEARVTSELLGDWIPVALPETWTLETPELSASLSWSVEEGDLVYEFSARSKVQRVSEERYAEFREDALELERRRLEGILLRRP